MCASALFPKIEVGCTTLGFFYFAETPGARLYFLWTILLCISGLGRPAVSQQPFWSNFAPWWWWHWIIFVLLRETGGHRRKNAAAAAVLLSLRYTGAIDFDLDYLWRALLTLVYEMQCSQPIVPFLVPSWIWILCSNKSSFISLTHWIDFFMTYFC